MNPCLDENGKNPLIIIKFLDCCVTMRTWIWFWVMMLGDSLLCCESKFHYKRLSILSSCVRLVGNVNKWSACLWMYLSNERDYHLYYLSNLILDGHVTPWHVGVIWWLMSMWYHINNSTNKTCGSPMGIFYRYFHISKSPLLCRSQ